MIALAVSWQMGYNRPMRLAGQSPGYERNDRHGEEECMAEL